jgi:hypothetical protein
VKGSFNVTLAHQSERNDAQWRLKVNGVTAPFAQPF